MAALKCVRIPLAMMIASAFAAPVAGAASREAATGTRVILLGTAAGPILRENRSQPANLLVVNGLPYVVDAGEGVARQLKRAGFAPDRVRAIFITHHHLDHDAGLVSLMAFIWSNRTRGAPPAIATTPVRIFGPAGTRTMVRAALDYLKVPGRILRANRDLPPVETMFEAHEVSGDGLFFRDENIRVTAVENTHFHFRPGSRAAAAGDKSWSYRFDSADRSVVFTGDTGPSDAVVRLAEGADLLVSEVNDPDAMESSLQAGGPVNPDEIRKRRFHTMSEHLTGEEVGRIASRANVGAVVLTHIAPGDTEGDAPYAANVRKFYKGPVALGRDLVAY